MTNANHDRLSRRPGSGAYFADLFIGGEWRPGRSSERIDVTNPADESVIASVADATVADAIEAVDAADSALVEWSVTPPRQRAEVLRRCFDLMTERAEDLAYLISLENGKSLPDSRGEVAYAAEFFRWYSEEAVRIRGEVMTAPGGANRIVVEHQPIGVCLLITPWNFPAAMATRKIAPALAAGCTVVLKPATATPLTAYALANLMQEAGVPSGAVNVLTTSQTRDVTNEMLGDPRVRLLSFTGSTEVGKVLLKEAAGQVIKCSMELGGNAPFIVFDDADLDAALEGLMVAKMRNGGQACTAANRIFVHTAVMKRFSQMLGVRMTSLKVGPGTEGSTECGPLVDAASVAKVSTLVEDAVGRGAQLITNNDFTVTKGHYYPPSVLVGVSSDADITREEVFGPVAALLPFNDEEEAVRAANDTPHGLAAYIFTTDLTRGLRVAERLESGMVAINRGLLSDPAAPFGGVKESGLGREGSHEGLLEFTETKYIAVDW